jgi:hypothetical protein
MQFYLFLLKKVKETIKLDDESLKEVRYKFVIVLFFVLFYLLN